MKSKIYPCPTSGASNQQALKLVRVKPADRTDRARRGTLTPPLFSNGDKPGNHDGNETKGAGERVGAGI